MNNKMFIAGIILLVVAVAMFMFVTGNSPESDFFHETSGKSGWTIQSDPPYFTIGSMSAVGVTLVLVSIFQKEGENSNE
ncbi:hypothetical protein CMO96_02615 [Candidatus Woesebacteria bacterium]|nr:hypothetical protein [Candidatus Woesebacteria bacterium]|tara:strand:- start:762 stop:998 length:237 start_codon:yes stop_codon:yes gene_type:complete